MNSERGHSPKKSDQIWRSKNKMKRTGSGRPLDEGATEEREDDDMELGSPSIPESKEEVVGGVRQPISYRDTLQKNNPNLNLDIRHNPIWDKVDTEYDHVFEDDEPPLEDDPTCPTILLTTAEKRMLREPWHKALIMHGAENQAGKENFPIGLNTTEDTSSGTHQAMAHAVQQGGLQNKPGPLSRRPAYQVRPVISSQPRRSNAAIVSKSIGRNPGPNIGPKNTSSGPKVQTRLMWPRPTHQA
ncbi:hypothetical protein Cgig2_004052 [Carnegiea gigantea]|uniref:Uncharacterized protein n=1 Tax=Carnegiea gigantea TaxID=171969 RepID=A0A9Q1KUR7_9CARY|nr:hypothetical protein Cgig2_004052 [Carnegiea gigantea]